MLHVSAVLNSWHEYRVYDMSAKGTPPRSIGGTQSSRMLPPVLSPVAKRSNPVPFAAATCDCTSFCGAVGGDGCNVVTLRISDCTL